MKAGIAERTCCEETKHKHDAMCPPAVVVGDGNIVNENNRGKDVYLHFSHYPEATPSVPSPIFLFPLG